MVAKIATKSPLSHALDHVVIAASGPASFAPYCHFQPGWLVGYDGVIAAGARVTEHIPAAPNTDLFRHAVARAGNPYSITVLPAGDIVVRGHRVRATIPCLALTEIPNVLPDVPQRAVNEHFRRALLDCSKLTTNKAVSIIAAALFVKHNSVVASDGPTIIESWHGCELGSSFLLPREFADSVGKVKHMPTSFGFGAETFTVWFGDDYWLRTNVYKATYPDTDVHFAYMQSCATELRPIPPDMLGAIETLKPFRESDYLTLTDTGLNTSSELTGASATFEHYMTYRGPYPTPGLRMAATHGKHIGFADKGSYWYGPTMRGITQLRSY